MAGIPVTRQEVDTAIGGISRGFLELLEDIEAFQVWWSAQDVEALEAIGFVDPDERALITSAANDLMVLRNVATGAATQAQLADFRTWPRQLAGLMVDG